MGESGRDVEDVARLHDDVDDRLERLAVQQGGVGGKFVQGLGIADTPVTLALALGDEDVVVVDVGADPAMGGGEAHHHIVKAPARDELERQRQLVHLGGPVVAGLHQHCPVLFPQVIVRLEGAVSGFPFAVEAGHQAGFDDVLHGQSRQLVRADGILKVGEAALDEEGAFLPVMLEEVGNIQIEFVHRSSRQKVRQS